MDIDLYILTNIEKIKVFFIVCLFVFHLFYIHLNDK